MLKFNDIEVYTLPGNYFICDRHFDITTPLYLDICIDDSSLFSHYCHFVHIIYFVSTFA